MKNILYVFADQWRKTGLGFEGEPVETPNMDGFARESLIFDGAISSYPLCSPHRASLLTGKYPYACGMWTNCKIGLDEVVLLKPQEITFGEVFKEHGYQTAYIGKWHLDASEMNFYNEPLSTAKEWDAYTPEGERRHGFDYWFSYGAMDNHLNPHYWQDSAEPIYPQKWSVEVETEKAIEYLKNRDSKKPFCMVISWNPPHPPYDQVPDHYLQAQPEITEFSPNVPESWRKDRTFLKKCREYYAAIRGVDENFGRLLNYLEEAGLKEDTIVILSADHGDMMGSQGLMGKNIWYEESIRIPFMVQGAGIKAGRTDVLFSSMDHMPTLLDLADLPIPNTVQGKSFYPVINGQAKSGNPENLAYRLQTEAETVFLSMIPGMPELIEPFRKLGLNHKAFGWRGLRGKDFTYVIDNGTEPGQRQNRYYYNLTKDPYQLNPIEVSVYSDFCQKWDPVLEGYLKQIKDPFLMHSLF
ncbi:sulfatase [Clostridiales bacterium COT073_COT-073]|nr:sulfatase [Clostridiales bacterium COT073_COT-073]